VWTGHEMIVLGASLSSSNTPATPQVIGAAYHPGSDTWRRLPDLDLSPQATTAVWNGREVVAIDTQGTAASYQPSTDQWLPAGRPTGPGRMRSPQRPGRQQDPRTPLPRDRPLRPRRDPLAGHLPPSDRRLVGRACPRRTGHGGAGQGRPRRHRSGARLPARAMTETHPSPSTRRSTVKLLDLSAVTHHGPRAGSPTGADADGFSRTGPPERPRIP
jgi:hypothetical protein